jgi:hypothetical protein
MNMLERYALAMATQQPRQRNGRLRIPLPFEDAVKAALEAKPPEKKPRKPRQKKAQR